MAQFQSWNDIPILGPFTAGITSLTMVASQVLAADPARPGVIFHNPGTKPKRVLPAGSALAGGSGGILIYPQEEYILLKTPNGQYNVNCAWNAVTDDNTDPILTVLDFSPSNPAAPMVQLTIQRHQQIPVTSPVAAATTTLGTGSQLVLPADPNRHGVQFHNPGTVLLGVCPSNLPASIGAGSIIILPGATKTIIGNDLVRINCGWNGIAQTGSNNALTALSLYG